MLQSRKSLPGCSSHIRRSVTLTFRYVVVLHSRVEFFMNPRNQKWIISVEILSKPSPLVSEGHLLAQEQIVLREQLPGYKNTVEIEGNSFTVEDNEKQIVIKNDKIMLSIDKQKCLLSKLSYNGKKMIEEGGRPDLWRAGTDNDKVPFLFENVFGPQTNKIRSLENASPYYLATIELEKPHINIKKDKDKVVIKASWELKADVGNCEINYTIHPDGTVACNVASDLKQLKDKRKPLPLRIGTAWKLSAGFDQLKWYGRGPDETYPGRDGKRPIQLPNEKKR